MNKRVNNGNLTFILKKFVFPKFVCLRKLKDDIRSMKNDISNRNVRILKSLIILIISVFALGLFLHKLLN